MTNQQWERIRLIGVAIAAIVVGTQLAFFINGCASAGGPRHVAVVSVVSAHAVLSAVQDTERALVCGSATAPSAPNCVAADVHQRISADLVTAFDLDGRVARLVRDAGPTGGLPGNVAAMLGQIGGIVDAILARLPSSPQKGSLIAQIGGVQ